MTDTPEPDEIKKLVAAWASGDEGARSSLLAATYPMMRALAQRELSSGASGLLTVSATTLAHECVLRMLGQERIGWNEGHFIALAATVIRRVSIDMARKKLAGVRGAGAQHVSLEHALDEADTRALDEHELCQLDHALEALAQRDARVATVVELRFFGGLSNQEIAAHLDIAVVTVVRDWRFGRAFLARRMGQGT